MPTAATTSSSPRATTVGVRELGRNPSRVLQQLDTGPVIVTSRGRPVAVLQGIDQDELEDLLLGLVYGADLAQADVDLAAGRTVDLDEVMAELQE